MDNRHWRESEHGCCVSGRHATEQFREWARRCDVASEYAALGDGSAAAGVMEDLAFEMRLLARGAELIVKTFDARSG